MALRPELRYRLLRSTVDDLHRLPDVLRLVAEHDEHQLLRRSEKRLGHHLTRGEGVFLYYCDPHRAEPTELELVGFGVAAFNDCTLELEVSHTVIAGPHRGNGMGEIVAHGVIGSQLIAEDEFSAIYMTVHPENRWCIQALETMGAEIVDLNELLGSSTHLDAALLQRRMAYVARNWNDDPKVALVTGPVIQRCAHVIATAGKPQGLTWRNGTHVSLMGEWCRGTDPDPESAGVLAHLQSVAAGNLPRVALEDYRLRRERPLEMDLAKVA